MHFPVYAAAPKCANPSIDQPIYRKPWSHIQNLLDTGAAFPIDMFNRKSGVQLCKPAPTALQIESLGLAEAVTILTARGNLIPFARHAQGVLGKPESINYPIPCAGARNRPQWCHGSILYAEAKYENHLREAIGVS